MTVEERAIEAEKRFYAIADKLKAMEGPDKYATHINFIAQNRDTFVEYGQEEKLQKVCEKIHLRNKRHSTAKLRRVKSFNNLYKDKILQLKRWDLLK